jgi:GDPmannose 4,6-dehydratase
LGIQLRFEGEGKDEIGVVESVSNPEFNLKEGSIVVRVDANYYRPTEVDLLIGDPTKANTQLGWKPKYDLAALVKDMVHSDLALFQRDQLY